MASFELKEVQGYSSKVLPKVRELVLQGFMIYGQEGYCRQGCGDVDSITVYLVRPVAGKSLIQSDPEIFSREG